MRNMLTKCMSKSTEGASFRIRKAQNPAKIVGEENLGEEGGFISDQKKREGEGEDQGALGKFLSVVGP